MTHKFKLPIGDWSDDGHGKCDHYVIESNVTAEELVPIYIAMDKEYGISNEFEDYEQTVFSNDLIALMDKLGLDIEKYGEKYDWSGSDEYNIKNSKSLAQLILDMLTCFDPTLNFSIVTPKQMPNFNNWLAQGVTKKGGGVMNLPGYGLYS
jgi:hypothetical protein